MSSPPDRDSYAEHPLKTAIEMLGAAFWFKSREDQITAMIDCLEYGQRLPEVQAIRIIGYPAYARLKLAIRAARAERLKGRFAILEV